MQQKLTGSAEAIERIGQAITRRRAISAVYNGARLEIQPHQLFLRNDAIYLKALNPEKSIRSDELPRLGIFKIAGLSEIAVVDREFDPLPSFDPVLTRDDEQSLLDILQTA